jgi:acetyl esterase/lipase
VEDFAILGGDEGVEIPARLHRPSDKVGLLPTMVFVHAGGYVFGSIKPHDSFCRLSLKHKIPVAHEDPYAALCWAGSLR